MDLKHIHPNSFSYNRLESASINSTLIFPSAFPSASAQREQTGKGDEDRLFSLRFLQVLQTKPFSSAEPFFQLETYRLGAIFEARVLSTKHGFDLQWECVLTFACDCEAVRSISSSI